MDDTVPTSDVHAEGLLVENTSAEMSPVAHQASVGKLGDWKPVSSMLLTACNMFNITHNHFHN